MEKENAQVHGNWAYIEAAHRNVKPEPIYTCLRSV